MRKKANRVFRYLFPAFIVGFGFILIIKGVFEKPKEESLREREKALMTTDKIEAKRLRMISHNPDTKAQLLVNSDKATQSGDKIILTNPFGIFDTPKGKTSLQAKEASYYESDREVHFLERVIFDHFSGLTASTAHAILDTQTQDISGNQGISAHHKKNTITAKSYEILPHQNIIHFSGNVCLNALRRNLK